MTLAVFSAASDSQGIKICCGPRFASVGGKSQGDLPIADFLARAPGSHGRPLQVPGSTSCEDWVMQPDEVGVSALTLAL